MSKKVNFTKVVGNILEYRLTVPEELVNLVTAATDLVQQLGMTVAEKLEEKE